MICVAESIYVGSGCRFGHLDKMVKSPLALAAGYRDPIGQESISLGRRHSTDHTHVQYGNTAIWLEEDVARMQVCVEEGVGDEHLHL